MSGGESLVFILYVAGLLSCASLYGISPRWEKNLLK